jgi:uncharacterized membrane protein YqjE
MENNSIEPAPLLSAGKRLMRRLLAIGENRLELLMVEMQEGTEQFLQMFFLAIGTAALSLLAAIGFSAAVVIAMWDRSRVAALLVLTAAYSIAAIVLCWRLAVLCRRQQTLPATLEQLKKDRACLEKTLS